MLKLRDYYRQTEECRVVAQICLNILNIKKRDSPLKYMEEESVKLLRGAPEATGVVHKFRP